jgi:CRP/FNR family cyclic AMP-dependent transcriptional regulator
MNSPYGMRLIENCLACEHRENRAFCKLMPDALKKFDEIGIFTQYPQGAVLFVEGQPPKEILVLCTGRVKLSTTSKDGKSLILKIAEPGDVLGLSANLADIPYEVTAETLEPCQTKLIKRQQFLLFLQEYGEASLNAARTMSTDYQATFQDVRSRALSGSAAGRLARLLLQFAHQHGETMKGKKEMRFTLTLTHDELAQMAGMSRETVTRLFTQFKKDHLIVITGSSVSIKNQAALEVLAV